MKQKTEAASLQPETVVLFGLPFHDVTMAETFARLDGLIAGREPSFFVTANLDFAAQAREDVELQRILVEADLVLCDGTPLVWASKLVGRPLRERVAGSDMVPLLAAHAEKQGYRIFLLGGAEESLHTAASRLQADYPQLPAVGYYSPPFSPLHEIDNAEILRRLQEARPDILLVAFGCPKQEKWIFMHYREMGIPCSIGVGATIDFLAGKFRRAPRWMAAMGMEWLYRLAQEPGRLMGRYWKDILFLAGQTWRELRVLGRVSEIDSSSAGPPPSSENLEVVHWQGALVAPRTHAFRFPLGDRPFVIDLSAVTSVDHAGLGTLLRAMRPAWASGISGCVAQPSPAVRRAFLATGLGRILPVAGSLEEIQGLLAQDDTPGGGRVVEQKLILPMPMRLTAANRVECLGQVVEAWERNPRARVLVLDLAATTFIDSSGLGLFLKAKRLAEARAGSRLDLLNPTGNILNVLRIAKLEDFFFQEEP